VNEIFGAHRQSARRQDEPEEDAPRIGRMNGIMQGLAQQASLDPGDDLGL
jgi:hypothetical protein